MLSPVKPHVFGGEWTSRKLQVLCDYLKAYNIALKNTPFVRAYIDAFAGSGSRGYAEPSGTPEPPLFPALAEPPPQQLLAGSAKMALQVEPRFDRYIFIEKDPGRCAELEGLKAAFPEQRDHIRIHQGDANQTLVALCRKNWHGKPGRREVLFLDPYGLQVNWSTIEAVAQTQAIDLWLLFPLWIAVNRMVPRDGQIPEGWRKRLNDLLGTHEWENVFYETDPQVGLFGDTGGKIKAPAEKIGRYFVQRLETIFAGVAEPGILRNAQGRPLFLFCFAAGNPRGAAPALKIARHLLKGLE